MRYVLAALALLAPALARADPAMDTVLASVAAEAAAPSERSRLYVERGGVADLYVIERLGRGRLHLVKNPRQDATELIVADGFTWLRTPAGWERSAAVTLPDGAFSLAALLQNGLSGLTEAAPAGDYRVFTGAMAWSNGGAVTGRLDIRIDAAGLPRMLRFAGKCGGTPCRFHQRIDYDPPVVIEPPG